MFTVHWKVNSEYRATQFIQLPFSTTTPCTTPFVQPPYVNVHFLQPLILQLPTYTTLHLYNPYIYNTQFLQPHLYNPIYHPKITPNLKNPIFKTHKLTATKTYNTTTTHQLWK